MKRLSLLKAFVVDPVQLNLKVKILSLLACFCAIFFIAIFTQATVGPSGAPVIVASMGASAVILFFIPNSPLAQPWPFAGGQICSAVVGMSCALNITETASAAAAAAGASVLVMLLLRCLHPPGAATALAPVMAGDSITSLGYSFVLTPVAINAGIMLLLALAINRWLMKRDYPSALSVTSTVGQAEDSVSTSIHKVGISEADIALALKESSSLVDVTPTELSHILSNAEMNTFKRVRGDITCADIMQREVISVEYGTEVEDAWLLIQEKRLKVMPVVDNTKRIIGILTWHDFFKHINLHAYDSLQEQFRRFIRRSTGVETDKPEAVGHIMTRSVVSLEETAHIVELIPLMSLQGHRQIPIIDKDHRLVGMVYQANLVAALYNQGLALAL